MRQWQAFFELKGGSLTGSQYFLLASTDLPPFPNILPRATSSKVDKQSLLSKFVSLRGRSAATDEAIPTGKIASSQKTLLAMTLCENYISNEDSRRTMRVNFDMSDCKYTYILRVIFL